MHKQLTHQDTHWEKKSFPIIIACDDWETPQNVGMAFRLADAFGVKTLWLGGQTPVPPNRKISKTARSCEKWIGYEWKEDLASSLQQAAEEGWQIWGLEITDQSKVVFQSNIGQVDQLILVVGGEKNGISQKVLNTLDQAIHVPMFGQNTSLNVVTALAIALGEYVRNS